MTREKAIEKITFLRDNACHFYLEKETENALDMAIEALRICGNFICAERLREEMYHQAFEVEPEGMVRWDSGLWIRYKLFENTLDNVLEENEQ